MMLGHMIKGNANLRFDYDQVPADRRATVVQVATEIVQLYEDTQQNIWQQAHLLVEIKELLGHGQWLPWLDAELGWNERTAQAVMTIARRFPDLEEYRRVARLPVSAVALLAAPSTPSEAIEVVAGMVADETAPPPTVQKVREIIRETKAKAVAPPPPPVNDDDDLDDDEARGAPVEDFTADLVDPELTDNPIQEMAIKLFADEWATLRKLGDGDVTAGIRLVLYRYAETAVPVQWTDFVPPEEGAKRWKL
jgi:hypothetical protein